MRRVNEFYEYGNAMGGSNTRIAVAVKVRDFDYMRNR